jgi:uncharacterized alkaline shock family protein YloU
MERERTEAGDGSIVVRPAAVAKVAGMTIREMEGVSLGAMRGLLISLMGVGPGTAAAIRRAVKAGVTVDAEAVVDVAVVIEYGLDIPGTVADIRRNIRSNIRKVTGLETRRINVEVTDISLPSEPTPIDE